jgi:beta-1,4-mannosyl-glycoprotein beta-1,4-N-acetylglucosaminyltransferase
MKIYDCFLFFNELDLLEIRLNELNSVVDKFVLVECSTTFSSKEKPFYFEENKKRYNKFLDKIIHIKVNDTPDLPAKIGRMGVVHNRHEIEMYQRDCIARGLINCKSDDVILLSDIDEIPRIESIKQACELLKETNQIIGFKQRFFYYFINGLCLTGNSNKEIVWNGTTACSYNSFPGAENMRKQKGNTPHQINNAGWHFSYLGGVENIALKIESFAHAEWDNEQVKDRNRLKKVIESGLDLFSRHEKQRQVYIPLDTTFPKYIIDNKEKFSHLIKE